MSYSYVCEHLQSRNYEWYSKIVRHLLRMLVAVRMLNKHATSYKNSQCTNRIFNFQWSLPKKNHIFISLRLRCFCSFFSSRLFLFYSCFVVMLCWLCWFFVICQSILSHVKHMHMSYLNGNSFRCRRIWRGANAHVLLYLYMQIYWPREDINASYV